MLCHIDPILTIWTSIGCCAIIYDVELEKTCQLLVLIFGSKNLSVLFFYSFSNYGVTLFELFESIWCCAIVTLFAPFESFWCCVINTLSCHVKSCHITLSPLGITDKYLNLNIWNFHELFKFATGQNNDDDQRIIFEWC